MLWEQSIHHFDLMRHRLRRRARAHRRADLEPAVVDVCRRRQRRGADHLRERHRGDLSGHLGRQPRSARLQLAHRLRARRSPCRPTCSARCPCPARRPGADAGRPAAARDHGLDDAAGLLADFLAHLIDGAPLELLGRRSPPNRSAWWRRSSTATAKARHINPADPDRPRSQGSALSSHSDTVQTERRKHRCPRHEAFLWPRPPASRWRPRRHGAGLRRHARRRPVRRHHHLRAGGDLVARQRQHRAAHLRHAATPSKATARSCRTSPTEPRDLGRRAGLCLHPARRADLPRRRGADGRGRGLQLQPRARTRPTPFTGNTPGFVFSSVGFVERRGGRRPARADQHRRARTRSPSACWPRSISTARTATRR